LKTVALLEELGCRYQIDIASGAGFEYYTGVIFQLYIGREKIGGGGRYDALIPSMGGGDVPASGFALYLDQLVKLVKPVTTATAEPEKILVRIKPDGTVKDALKAAEQLRNAGFIAVVGPANKVSAGINWSVDVTGSRALLTVTDLAADRKYEVSDIDKVIALIERQSDDKVSPA